MDDQDKAKQNTEQTKASAPPPEGVKPSDSPAAGPATAQQFAAVEQQMTGFERATLRWARTAVILSGVAAVFVCAQWWEMHQGGVDTHDLADATNRIASANRPYVGLDIISGYHMLPTGPDGVSKGSTTPTHDSIDMLVKAEIRNFGGLPALEVDPQWKIYFNGVQQPPTAPSRSRPSTIFPGQAIFMEINVGRENYKAIALDGTKILVIDLSQTYYGPGGEYTNCQRDEYSSSVNAFMNVGSCEGKIDATPQQPNPLAKPN